MRLRLHIEPFTAILRFRLLSIEIGDDTFG